MTSVVQLTREGAVALILVNNPPVNALGHALRAGLLKAFTQAQRDEQVELIMLRCAGKTFIAGADIREFGQPAQAPILQELTLAIENCNKPVLAVPTEPAEASALFAAQRSEIARTRPDSFSAPRCVAAIEAATRLPLIEGLQHERALFLECMASPQRAALIEDFFARRQAAKNRQS